MKNWGLHRTVTAKLWWLMAISTGTMPAIAQTEILPSFLDQTHNIQPTFIALQQEDNVLGPDSVGSTVKDVQSMLALMGYYSGAVDGNYSQSTVDAVRQFQTEAGLAADGIVGPATWQKLLPNIETLVEPTQVDVAEARPSAADVPSSGTHSDRSTTVELTAVATAGNLPILRIEDSGPDVEQLQIQLAELNLYSGPLDGVFGAQTEQAVVNFQRQVGLDDDGVVGPATWQRLLQ